MHWNASLILFLDGNFWCMTQLSTINWHKVINSQQQSGLFWPTCRCDICPQQFSRSLQDAGICILHDGCLNLIMASRSSRHVVQNRPIFFARSPSNFVLKLLIVFAITVSLSNIFHVDTTQWQKNVWMHRCQLFILSTGAQLKSVVRLDVSIMY